MDSLENQESNFLNEEDKENISKEPLVTVEMLPYDIKINKPDSIGEIYMEATYKNNSEYTIKGYNLTILLKDSNEATYLSSYDTVLSGETSPKFESSGPQTQKLDDVEILKTDITAIDNDGKDIYMEYDNKTKTYNTY